MVLGSHVGSEAFESLQVLKKASNYAALMTTLSKLKIQSQFLLLRYCLSSSLMYWARTVPPEHSDLGLSYFHDDVLNFVSAMSPVPCPFLVSLPLKLGGLGFPNLSTISGISYVVCIYNGNSNLKYLDLYPDHLRLSTLDHISSLIESSTSLSVNAQNNLTTQFFKF
ncbi:hypothetical protein RCL1_007938 [Eukaryota sp. TZLM3-RCL]